MKSSRPVSAHWRSSNSSTVVPRSAIRSKKMRQAANSTSRPPAGAGSRPEQGEQRRLHPARSSASGTYSATDRRRSAPGGGLVVRLGQSGAPADHLAERPERDPLAVRRRAAAVPVDVLEHAVDVLLELPGQAALADAPGPADRDEPRPAVAARSRRAASLSVPQLLVTADERRLRQVRPALAAALGDRRAGLATPGRARPCP